MKILIVTPYYKPAYVYGGPVKSISQLAEALASYGHDVVVYTTNANGEVNLTTIRNNPAIVNGVSVFYFNRQSAIAPKRYFFSAPLTKACKSNINRFDIVYISGNWTFPFLPATFFSRFHNIPYVISTRGSFMDRALEKGKMKKYIYLNIVERGLVNSAAYIHCTSRLEFEQTKKMNFKPPFITIPNPINLDPFLQLPIRGKLRSQLQIPENSPITLFVGRLQKIKQLDLIIQVFKKVSNYNPDAHLIIVGSEEDETGTECKNLVAKLNLQNKVHFLGELTGDELLQAYRDADLLVLLSKSENFGMAAAEGMASGLPVIVGENVGISEYVKQSNAGLVINIDDPLLVDAWTDLCTNPIKRKEMGDSAKQVVFETFSASAIAGKMTELFTEIINSNHT